MSTTFTRAQGALLTPTATGRGHDPRALHGQAHAGPFAALGRGLWAVAMRLTEARHRRRTLTELRALSDRELADIGLHRSEIGRVFDRPATAVSPRPARGMRAANDLRAGGASA